MSLRDVTQKISSRVKDTLFGVYGFGRRMGAFPARQPLKEKKHQMLSGFLHIITGGAAVYAALSIFSTALVAGLASTTVAVPVFLATTLAFGAVSAVVGAFGIGYMDEGARMITGKAAFYPGYERDLAAKKQAKIDAQLQKPVVSVEDVVSKYMSMPVDATNAPYDAVLARLKTDAAQLGYSLRVDFANAAEKTTLADNRPQEITATIEKSHIRQIKVHYPL